jgi:geranylgeranyl diphosphate synthase type I
LKDAEKTLSISYLQKALFSVGGGELIDVESALYPILESDPVAVAHYKTAGYSFQYPLLCGAELAGASNEQLSILEEIGLEIGVAFQLRDDLLGVFGEESKTGKSNRSDIFEKKRTMLVQFAYKKLSEENAKRLEELFDIDRPISKAEAEEVVVLIESTGATQDIENQISQRANKTLALIESLQIDKKHKLALNVLVEKITQRTV